MADVQILAAGTASAPLDYTIPNAQELVTLAANATFDGTGAAGDFLPVLELLSDSGIVIARALGSRVAAGASADVSFFPRVGQAAAAAAAVSLPWGFLKSVGNAVGSGAGYVNVDFDLTNLNNSGATSGDSDITIGDVGGRVGLILNSVGTYLVGYRMSGSIGGAAAAGSVTQFSSPTGVSGDHVAGSTLWPWLVPAAGGNPIAVGADLTWENRDGTINTVPRKISMQIAQNSTQAATYTAEIAALKISATASADFT